MFSCGKKVDVNVKNLKTMVYNAIISSRKRIRKQEDVKRFRKNEIAFDVFAKDAKHANYAP